MSKISANKNTKRKKKLRRRLDATKSKTDENIFINHFPFPVTENNEKFKPTGLSKLLNVK